MRSRLPTYLWVVVLVLVGNACVDPLDPSAGGPPAPGEPGYTQCEDPNLPDSDGDGSNDACEAILQTDPFSTDTDADGIPDGQDYPPVEPTTPEAQSELDGLASRVMNETADSSLLGLSGLTESAPAGTRVQVAAQALHIIFDSKPENGGSDLLINFCKAKKKDGSTPTPPFLYYEVQGSIEYCIATPSGAADQCGPAVISSLQLCGSLSTLVSENSASITESNFLWTAGKVTNTNGYSGNFSPELLFKKKNADDTGITVTISAKNPQNSMYTKLDTSMKNAFGISGVIYGNQANNQADIAIQTTDELIIEKTWKRTGSTVYQSATGKWVP